jgi:hypothetical protein
MRLFHFSEDGDIARFEPRPVRLPSPRPEGRDWLNGPLVWAVDERHQPMYLFPRDCPRILLWQTPHTTEADRAAWWGDSTSRIIACAEWEWFERIRTARLFRYELPAALFEDLDDAGMWVSRSAVDPMGVDIIDDLIGALERCHVELRFMPSLAPLRAVWSSSAHASGLRLRNARGWTDADPDPATPSS